MSCEAVTVLMSSTPVIVVTCETCQVVIFLLYENWTVEHNIPYKFSYMYIGKCISYSVCVSVNHKFKTKLYRINHVCDSVSEYLQFTTMTTCILRLPLALKLRSKKKYNIKKSPPELQNSHRKIIKGGYFGVGKSEKSPRKKKSNFLVACRLY